MNVAAIYDIHANPIALKAVLNDLEKYNVDLIIVGGDVVSGPLANEAMTLLHNLQTPKKFILGNAESEVLRHLNGEEINGLIEQADNEAIWAANQLTGEYKKQISNWSKTVTVDIANLGSVLFCHGTPQSDIEIFTKLTPKEELLAIFEKVDVPIVVCGHTHMQFDLKIGNTRVVNAGSVGMPFGKTGADWLLLDNQINFKNTKYDLEEAAKLIRESDYPYAESFVTNSILNPPSEENALKMLESLKLKQEM